MIPKEKAGELIKKYAIKLPTQYNNRIDETSGVKIWDYNIDLAKQCALIAVEEIINVVKRYETKKGKLLIDNINLLYWQEVKQEMRKL